MTPKRAMVFNAPGNMQKPPQREALPVRPATHVPTFSKQGEEIKEDEHPLLKRIRTTLSNAQPERWRVGGEELNIDLKHPKHLETWERVYAIDVPNGVLVLRSSIPVKSEYLMGGYTVTPKDIEKFSVELRSKGWNYRELVDPFHRKSSRGENKCEVLLAGRMAQELFVEVHSKVSEFYRVQKKEFEEQCLTIQKNLLDLVRKSHYDGWIKDEKDAGVVRYGGRFEGIEIEVHRQLKDEEEIYRLILSKGELVFRNVSSNLAKETFEAIEGLERDAGLVALNKLIEDAGF